MNHLLLKMMSSSLLQWLPVYILIALDWTEVWPQVDLIWFWSVFSVCVFAPVCPSAVSVLRPLRHTQVETVIADRLPSNCCVTTTFHPPFLASCSQSHLCWHHISVHWRIFNKSFQILVLLSPFYWCWIVWFD